MRWPGSVAPSGEADGESQTRAEPDRQLLGTRERQTRETSQLRLMIDFYLLSLSREIFAFSAYKHGSGFSYWCAKTYDIPYVCKYICDAK